MESGLFADIAAIDVNDKVAHGEALDHDQSACDLDIWVWFRGGC